MALVEKNNYGIITADNEVLAKMVVEKLLFFEGQLLPCNRKGKVIRKGIFTGFHEYSNAVEIREKNGQIYVRIYAVTVVHGNMKGVAKQLFKMIDDDFATLCLERPVETRLHILGFLPEDAKQPVGRKYAIRRRSSKNRNDEENSGFGGENRA